MTKRHRCAEFKCSLSQRQQLHTFSTRSARAHSKCNGAFSRKHVTRASEGCYLPRPGGDRCPEARDLSPTNPLNHRSLSGAQVLLTLSRNRVPIGESKRVCGREYERHFGESLLKYSKDHLSLFLPCDKYSAPYHDWTNVGQHNPFPHHKCPS